MANGLSDFFNGLADLFRALGQDELAELCRVFAIIWNGLAGSLRTRFVDYLTTGETLAENGSKNPAGLMTILGMLAVDMGQCVAGATSGFANNVATAVAGLGTAPVAAQPEGPNERQPTGDGDIELQPALERRTSSDDEPVDNDSVDDEPSGHDEEFFEMVKKL